MEEREPWDDEDADLIPDVILKSSLARKGLRFTLEHSGSGFKLFNGWLLDRDYDLARKLVDIFLKSHFKKSVVVQELRLKPNLGMRQRRKRK